MGFTGKGAPRAEVRTVATLTGKVTRGRPLGRARVWVLEDRSLVLCSRDPSAPKGIRRTAYTEAIVSSVWSKPQKLLTVTLRGDEVVVVDGKDCGCGMGAAGNAGPMPGPFDVVRVRVPDWHTVELA